MPSLHGVGWATTLLTFDSVVILPSPRLIISSATLEVERLLAFFNMASQQDKGAKPGPGGLIHTPAVLSVEGRTHPVQVGTGQRDRARYKWLIYGLLLAGWVSCIPICKAALRAGLCNVNLPCFLVIDVLAISCCCCL